MSKPPPFYAAFRAAHPDVVAAYEALGEAARGSGPLSPGEAELVKLGFAAGARLAGAIHSHTRRALDAGVAPEALRHVALLAITTLGFPQAMAIRAMIEEQLVKAGHAGAE
jgi:alkylhydroperoxidase/carboxymuconolactone decarboxylase family protein YurZ